MKKVKSDKLKFLLIETDKCCLISDCFEKEGYCYDYHNLRLDDYIYDGKNPKPTFNMRWFEIQQKPTAIQKKETVYYNQRYVINNPKLITVDMPEIIYKYDKDKFDEDVIEAYYTYKTDKKKEFVDVEFEYELIMSIENFEKPIKFSYPAINRARFSNDKDVKITNADFKHQMLDSIIFPDILLYSRPCKISSQQLYDITRKHIIDNIDNKVAKISSNYDFCFDVQKIIPLIEPEAISYNNIFARKKKDKLKTIYKIKEFKYVKIFEMTHEQEQYKGYTSIEGITANNEKELKEKIDEWLDILMEKINEPLHLCEHCKGTGYKD